MYEKHLNASVDDDGEEDEDEELDERLEDVEDEDEEEDDEEIEVHREPSVYDNLLKKLEATTNSQAKRHKERYILFSVHYKHLSFAPWLAI